MNVLLRNSRKYLTSNIISLVSKQKNQELMCKNSSRHHVLNNTNIKLCSSSFHTSICHQDIFNVQDEEDFQERVLKSKVPVLVDFHAGWCGPCKILAPRLEKVISDKAEQVHLAKVDIDAMSDLSIDYGVSVVPSVIAFKNGKSTDKFVGLQEETNIEAFVEKLLG